MSKERTSRTKVGLAAAILAAMSVVGLGGAALAQNPTPAQPALAQSTSQQDEQVSEMPDDPAAEAAEEAAEGPDDEVQDPMLNGSITAPAEKDGLSEADEAKALESLATITPDEAQAAATSAVPGDVIKVELDNENGSVVYSVEINDGNGGHIDVKVDAGNGTVLHQDSDNDSEG